MKRADYASQVATAIIFQITISPSPILSHFRRCIRFPATSPINMRPVRAIFVAANEYIFPEDAYIGFISWAPIESKNAVIPRSTTLSERNNEPCFIFALNTATACFINHPVL